MNLEEIYYFHCPRWKELPEDPIFNREAVDFVNTSLSPILDEDLTTTMVQNYVKWELMPSEAGRKYSRLRIAYLIVISIYKQAINLSNVKKGVDLLLKHYSLDNAYDNFAMAVEEGLKKTFHPLLYKEDYKGNKKPNKEELGLYAVANSFAYKLLGNLIIKADGVKNIGEDYE